MEERFSRSSMKISFVSTNVNGSTILESNQTIKLIVMRKNTFLFFLVAVLLLSAGVAVAQQKTISGTVKDTTGNGLPSIAVTVKGTNNSVLTDAQGNFRINLPSENSTLVVSAIGFNAEEISTGGKNLIIAVLQQKNDELSEVIVTGFGTRTNTRKLAYAVQEIKGEDITRTNNANIVNSIQGKVAGVMVNQGAGGPQSGSRIRIRGNTSLPNSLSTSSNNTQPLFVIDGVLIRPNTSGADSWGANQDMGNIVKNLNPDDFASYTVLKGSSATALYGSDGQNGVILITTKKGVARKGLGVSVSHTESFDKAYKLYDLQNEYGSGIDPTFQNVGGVDIIDPRSIWKRFSFGPKFNNQQVRDVDGHMQTYKPNDPLSFFQTGKYINTNVAVEGGNERSTFRFSYSNLANTSVMPNNKMARNNFNIRATQKIGSVINMDVSVNYTATKSDNPLPNGGNSNPLFAFIYNGTRSTDLDYWYNNYIDTAIGGRKTGDPKDPYRLATPLWQLKEWKITQKEENLRANMDLSANITSWLSVLGRVNLNRLSENFESKKRGQAAGFLGPDAEYKLRQSNNNDLRFQGLLNANKELGSNLNLSASVGGETNRSLGGQYSESTTKSGFQVADRYVIANSLDPATILARFNPTKRTDAVYVYGDLTWKDMLTLSFSARNDWNSTLTYASGVGDYSYFYPSVGLAYVFTDMPSFKSKVLSFGKLRASYGYTGFGTDAYTANRTGQYRRGIPPDGSPVDFITTGGTTIPLYTFRDAVLPNYNLKNQLTKEMEFGVELRFFNNRLGIDAAYYKKNTYNQIFPIPAAQESGLSSRLINAGNVQNQGIEIVLSGSPIRTNNFQWNTVVNFTRNRNKIIELAEGVSPYELEIGFGNDVKAVAIPGGDYGILQTSYGYAYYQKRDAEGKPLSHPNNGKKVIGDPANADFGMTFLRTGQYDGTTKNLGSIMEKFLLSTVNNFNYKNFTFGFQIDAKVGGLMGSGTHQYGSAFGSLKNSLFGRDAAHGGITYTDGGVTRDDGIIPDGVFQDGYTSPLVPGVDMGGMTFQEAYDQGLVNPKPAYQYYDDLSNWGGGIREYSIFENTWVSLREISAGYNLPQSISRKVSFQNLRISAVARNIIYLYRTAPDGINPEGIYSNRAAAFMEYGGMPYVRSIGFTLSGSF